VVRAGIRVVNMTYPAPKNLFSLAGKRALVTGAGRGLGARAAQVLAGAGAHVTLIARSVEQITEVSKEINSKGEHASAHVVDVTDATAFRAFVDSQAPFDVLINNAGTNQPKLLIDTTDESMDFVLNLNVNAAMRVARDVVRGIMAAKRGGSIINISSQMGHVGSPRRTVYCASKHAMEGFTKALAWEVGEYNIRVNSLCPTFIETPMTKPMLDDPAFFDFVVKRTALGRVGRLDELDGPLLFLASEASSLMTGAALVIDAGWTAQ
jgi:NAD(P)-dependent dehydrogenase (short-subunit alcohol dehydrogenase family)